MTTPAPAVFAYLKPNTLDTSGYAYGSAILPSAEQDRVSVSRVASGRWASLDAFECERATSEVSLRLVREEEASSGIGAYVGSCVCVAKASDRSPKAWYYGVVTGYTWIQERLTGELHLCFGAESRSVPFNPSELQDLAVPSYAMRPCYLVPVADVMPMEMRQLHSAALDHLTGTGSRATRSSSMLLRKLAASDVDESQAIPFFDVAAGKVEFVSIKYALDFSYYHDSAALAQRGNNAGVADEPPYVQGQLWDSDDSDGDEGSDSPPAALVAQTLRKRERSAREGVDEDLRSLKQLRASYNGNASMLRSIDHIVALRESPMSLGSGSSMVSYGGLVSNKAQCQPSSLQRVIYGQLVNGTYAPMEPQLLLETLQIQHELFSFLTHPAILRAFYSWNFGLRGLSIMHFAPVAGGTKCVSSHNMTDFSKTASLPAANQPQDLGAVVDAVDGLAVVVAAVYLPYVEELVGAARKFIVPAQSRLGCCQNSLKTKGCFPSADARNELVHWINVRFERIRGFLALRDLAKAKLVSAEFSFPEPSYVQLMQTITDVRMSALQALKPAHAHSNQVATSSSSSGSKKEGRQLSKQLSNSDLLFRRKC